MVNAGVPTGKTFATNIGPHPRAPDADTITQLKKTDAKAIYRPLPSFEWVYKSSRGSSTCVRVWVCGCGGGGGGRAAAAAELALGP
jgi:hypothetical protein